MDFEILGPLGVRDEAGKRIPIPGARERALLAALLIHAGEVVSADRLIEDLWGEHQPAHAMNALQAVVSRLRKALGPRGQELLVTKAPGYVLAAEPDQVDAGRFERLVAVGRRLAEHGAPGAAAQFAEAMALWRGPPLADFAYEDFAQAEIGRLEEARLAAQEDLIESQLAEGHHAELVGELEQMVAANPLRERLRAQLMLALYRSGRQADALALYRRGRSLLEEELGLDPSPALRQLEQAILTQDPALAFVTRPGSGPRHNLPARVTSFVGRGREQRELRKLIGQHRLVTLTGPGGAGKSSLAVELGASLAAVQPAGVWLVELASLGDAPALEEAAAAVLGVRDAPQPGAMGAAGSVTERMIDFLRANELLLILDNCEHLVEPCARLAETLLRSAPGLRILATSREALGIPGEAVWPTPPLQLPDETTPAPVLPTCDALRLFEERAAAACPGFELSPRTAPAVAGICRRLDGMPLAIELAASRMRTLSLAELAVRLEDRFRLLTGGGRSAVPRHRTLRATVEWSYGLLAERERCLFDRLSVFSGGWSLEAAEEVCSGDGIDRQEVLDLLTRLIDQSMVDAAGGGGRFRMLETLREYARARLEESGQAAAVRRRHVAYYLALADRADPRVPGSEQWKWYRGLEPDGDNLRAALTCALDDGDTDSALALGACLGLDWFLGNRQEGRRWLPHLLEIAPASRTLHRARALLAYGLVQAFHRTEESGRAGREALSICEELGDRWAGATAKLLIVLDMTERGDVSAATRLLDEAEATFRAVSDRRGEAIAWWLRSAVGLHVGDLALAVEVGRKSLERFRELQDAWGMASVLGNLAELARRRGDYREAVTMCEQSLALARSGGLAYAEQDDLVRLGTLFMLLGEQDRADALCQESLALANRIGYRVGTALSYSGMGMLARRRGDLDLATEYHLEALSAAREHGAPLPIARCIEGLAGVAAAGGDGERAARLLGSAAGIRDRIGAPLLEPERADVEGASATARAALGEVAFERAYRAGRALDLDQVLNTS
ncbi:MAG TPA: BTAD domain-containing putative transcriptional regulator [Methylomirabilota bacterium]|nr:BTAD domain-containing putative transcriptional regulator [Methylomirabilota bacterium]